MIPDYIRVYESGLKNFSLHYDKFSMWDGGKARVEHHTNAAATILKHSDTALKSLHKHQCTSLAHIHHNGGFCLEITAKLETPFVTGLGGCHPTEAGFILDRNTGVPFIPASALKGVLRLAHALDIAEKIDLEPDSRGTYEISDREMTLRKYFGDTDTGLKDSVRGQLVFLDAFPATVPTMKKDIMNPHFGKYYKGEAPPTETENPIPVMFMSVKEGIDFKFRLFILPLAEGATVPRLFDENDRLAIMSMVTRACEQLGFGAKTSVGYGRMSAVHDTTGQMKAAWLAIKLEKEIKLYPWRAPLRELENITDWGMFRQKGLEKEILLLNKVVPEVSQKVFDCAAILRKSWKSKEDRDSRDSLIAQWLQPTGLTWPPVEEVVVAAVPEVGIDINALSKWVDYCAAPINLETLSKKGLKQLRDKLKVWGCDAKDAKADKKAAWEELKRFMAG